MPQVEALLKGAYDIHVHGIPDVVPRAQTPFELARDARQAGMAGLVVKDHTGSTVGTAYAINAQYSDGPRFYSALCLNPPVGGINPFAAEAALREGADVIYFPTYGAAHQIRVKGPNAFASAYPRPRGDWAGIAILDESGQLKPEALAVLDLIAQHDAVLATGHLSPREVLALFKAAQERGVKRMVADHVSAEVPGMSVEEQKEAVRHGAFVEHCLLATMPGASRRVPPEAMAAQIRQVGVEHVIISSDLGQAANGPVVAGFARLLGLLLQGGVTETELRVMIVDNPRALLERRAGAT